MAQRIILENGWYRNSRKQLKLPDGTIIAEGVVEWQILSSGIVKIITEGKKTLVFDASGNLMKNVKDYVEINENYYYIETSKGKNLYNKDGRLIATNLEAVIKHQKGYLSIQKKKKWYRPFDFELCSLLRPDGTLVAEKLLSCFIYASGSYVLKTKKNVRVFDVDGSLVTIKGLLVKAYEENIYEVKEGRKTKIHFAKEKLFFKGFKKWGKHDCGFIFTPFARLYNSEGHLLAKRVKMFRHLGNEWMIIEQETPNGNICSIINKRGEFIEKDFEKNLYLLTGKPEEGFWARKMYACFENNKNIKYFNPISIKGKDYDQICIAQTPKGPAIYRLFANNWFEKQTLQNKQLFNAEKKLLAEGFELCCCFPNNWYSLRTKDGYALYKEDGRVIASQMNETEYQLLLEKHQID